MSRPGGAASDELVCTTQSGEALIGAQSAGRQQVPALTVLFHRDWRQIGKRALLRELLSGREAMLSRTLPRFAPVDDPTEPDEPLGDPRLSRQPLRIVPLATGG